MTHITVRTKFTKRGIRHSDQVLERRRHIKPRAVASWQRRERHSATCNPLACDSLRTFSDQVKGKVELMHKNVRRNRHKSSCISSTRQGTRFIRFRILLDGRLVELPCRSGNSSVLQARISSLQSATLLTVITASVTFLV